MTCPERCVGWVQSHPSIPGRTFYHIVRAELSYGFWTGGVTAYVALFSDCSGCGSTTFTDDDSALSSAPAAHGANTDSGSAEYAESVSQFSCLFKHLNNQFWSSRAVKCQSSPVGAPRALLQAVASYLESRHFVNFASHIMSGLQTLLEAPMQPDSCVLATNQSQGHSTLALRALSHVSDDESGPKRASLHVVSGVPSLTESRPPPDNQCQNEPALHPLSGTDARRSRNFPWTKP